MSFFVDGCMSSSEFENIEASAERLHKEKIPAGKSREYGQNSENVEIWHGICVNIWTAEFIGMLLQAAGERLRSSSKE